MAKSSSEIFESSRLFGSISASVPFKSLSPKSKQKAPSVRRSKFRSDSKNISPIDPNIQISDPPLCASVSFPKKSPSKFKSKPLKEELSKSVVGDKAAEAPDPPVKVEINEDESETEENSSENHGSNQSTVLEGPVLSESPNIKNSQRKSLIFASNHLPAQDDVDQTSKNRDIVRKSPQPDNVRSSLRSSRIFAGPTDSLAASLHRGMQIIDHHQRTFDPAASSVSFSFEHLALKPCLTADKDNVSVQNSPEGHPSDQPSATFVCVKCRGRRESNDTRDGFKSLDRVNESASSNELAVNVVKDMEKELALAMKKDEELSTICKDQAAQIELLNKKLEKCKCMNEPSSTDIQPINEDEPEKFDLPNTNKLLTWNNDENKEPDLIKEKFEILEKESIPSEERETLQREIEMLKNKLQFHTDAPTRRSTDRLRSSLLSQSFQLRKSSTYAQGSSINSVEELEKEREKWMEMESEWISLTDELRIEIEANRQRAEELEMELRSEKKCTEELDDVLKRSVLNHARMIEHYTELQEKYNDISEKHRTMMEGIAEVKRAASKASVKGRHGPRFAKALSAELSALRVEREREREILKKENRILKIQLKDTAEAVHAAGELLVRLREAEAAASLAEEKNSTLEEENEKLRKQIEKVKRKQKMEIITMKQYLAESRLPEAALRHHPLYREESDAAVHYDNDEAWRAEFGPIYQESL